MRYLPSIAYAVFLAGVIGFGLLFLSTLTPLPGQLQVRIVQSGSMEPEIPMGSVIIIAPGDRYQTGEVITYNETDGQIPVTHRVVATEVVSGEYHYTTQGDANDSPDQQSVPQDQVLGRVLLDIPYLGFVLDFARQPWGFFLLIILPISIVAVDEVRILYRELSRKSRSTD